MLHIQFRWNSWSGFRTSRNEDIPITEQSMRSNIILIWKCPSLARHGKLALPTESLTTSDINQLQSSSLYWETEVNDKILLQSDDLFTSTVRDVINIKTVVTIKDKAISAADFKKELDKAQ